MPRDSVILGQRIRGSPSSDLPEREVRSAADVATEPRCFPIFGRPGVRCRWRAAPQELTPWRRFGPSRIVIANVRTGLKIRSEQTAPKTGDRGPEKGPVCRVDEIRTNGPRTAPWSLKPTPSVGVVRAGPTAARTAVYGPIVTSWYTRLTGPIYRAGSVVFEGRLLRSGFRTHTDVAGNTAWLMISDGNR